MAQNTFNGVAIGGTVQAPTIINNSQKPAIGYAAKRITSNGIDTTFEYVSFPSIARGTPALPGTERPFGMYIGFQRSVVDPATGQPVEEGEPLSYELVAVLFADGTYIGPDDRFDTFAGMVSGARSFARDTQYRADRYTVLEQERTGFKARLKANLKSPSTSVDLHALRSRSVLADVVMDIFNTKGIEEADAALARFASLPDVTKGEQ